MKTGRTESAQSPMLKRNPPEVDRSDERGLVPLFQGWAHFCKNVHYQSYYEPGMLPHAFIIPALWRLRQEALTQATWGDCLQK